MTKEEKIQEAYGDHWDNFIYEAKKCAWNNNGWISQLIAHAPEGIELDFDRYTYRPKSLRGIEHNHGWRKIESDEDLPLHGDSYIAGYLLWDGSFMLAENAPFSAESIKDLYIINKITHYKVADPPPMY